MREIFNVTYSNKKYNAIAEGKLKLDKRFCRKCLTEGLSDKEYYKTISNYISNIPEELKTPEDIYAARLESCSKCQYLMNGLCRLCGCFVEIRAASIKNYCPNKIPYW